MWAVIALVLGFVIDFFLGDDETNETEGERSTSLLSSVWGGLKDTGSSILDWFTDDEVSNTTKLITGLGAGYLIDSDATSDLVRTVTGDAANVISETGSATGSALTDIFKSIPAWAWIVGGVALFMILDDD